MEKERERRVYNQMLWRLIPERFLFLWTGEFMSKQSPSKCTLRRAPGLDYTQLFISLPAAAGTGCMSLLSPSPSLYARNGPKVAKFLDR